MTTEQLGQAVLELVTEDAALKEGLEKAERTVEKSLKSMGDAMTKAGKSLTMKVTAPIMAMFTLAVKEAGEEEEALAMLENAIRTVGNEGKISAANLAILASELQKTTRFSDDQSLSALALLESLTGLSEEGLAQLLPLVQDFATITGTDLSSAIRLVANVASGSVDSLGRYGKAVEDNSTGADRLAQLTETLTSKFKGAAEVAGTTGLGPFVTLKNTIAELAQTFGTILLPILTKFADVIRGVAERLQTMDPRTRELILTIAAIAAAIGPALLVFGSLVKSIGTLITVIKAVGVAFNFLTASPIGLIIAAVALLALGVYELITNWDSVVAFFKDLWEKVVGFFQRAWEWIKEIIANLWQWIKDHIEWILMAINPLAGVVALIIKNWDSISAFFTKLWTDVKNIFKGAIDAILGWVKDLYMGVYNWLITKFQAIVQGIRDALDKVTGFFKDLYDKVVGHSLIPDMVNGIINEFGRMEASLNNVTRRMAGMLVDTLGQAFMTLGASIVEGASAWDDFKTYAKDTLASLLEMIGKELLIWALKAAIPMIGLFNPVGAALAGAASIAAFVAAGAIRAMGEGGMINEPVFGIGARSGTNYLLGEAGPEYVVPAGGIGRSIVLDIHDNFVAGASIREFAQIIRREFESLAVLGV